MRLTYALAAIFAATSVHAQVTIQRGSTLSELINNLYGGNGIQLKQNTHAAHFGDTHDFEQFSEALQKTLQARPLFPIPSSVGVVSYKLNEETGTYDRVQGALGPILSERATTSGKGHANFAVSYTFSDFENFEGQDTIPLTLRHCLEDRCTGGNLDQAFLRDVISVDVRMKLKSQVMTTSVVYGFTDRLDVGLVIPYLRNDLTIFTHGSIIRDPGSHPEIHVFDPLVETPDQFGTAHAVGIGDITARAKLQLPIKLPVQTALLTDVTFPSGNKDDFLGTGDLRVRATFIVSHTGTRFAPHLNVGYELNTSNTALSTIDYRAGSEVVVTPRLTMTADLVGTVQPSNADEFRVRALDGGTLVGRSQIDGALGAKWQLTPRSLFMVNLLSPMNDTGIRPNSVFTFGLQVGL